MHDQISLPLDRDTIGGAPAQSMCEASELFARGKSRPTPFWCCSETKSAILTWEEDGIGRGS